MPTTSINYLLIRKKLYVTPNSPNSALSDSCSKICFSGSEVEEDRSPLSHNKTQEIRIQRAAVVDLTE